MLRIIPKSLFIFVALCSFNSGLARETKFLWGTANAAFQVEGSPQDSDWLRFTHIPGKIKDRSNADIATDFWNRYPEDFELARELGSNAFRMSIAWERIQPTPNTWNEEALEKYQTMVLELRKLQIEPIITLHHFALPQWLANEGGLTSSRFAEYFTAYAMKVIQKLGQSPTRVQYWITFNEPDILAFCGYFWGCWPPQKYLDGELTAMALFNIAKAHLQLMKVIRTNSDYHSLQFSIAKHWALVSPKTSSNKDLQAAQLYDQIFNRQLVQSLISGKIRIQMPKSKVYSDDIVLPAQRSGLDFLGINYYQRSLVSHMAIYPGYRSETGPGPKNDLGWEMFPEGLYLSLKDVARYQLPILISENGVADHSDRLRSQFLTSHIDAMKRAYHEKVPLLGYLHWSLTDNFEWAEGLTPRFGLVEIDYKTLARKKRPSFEVYKKLIQNGL